MHSGKQCSLHSISSFALTHNVWHWFIIYSFQPCFLTCLFIIFLSRFSQSIFSSFTGSRMVLRSASSTTFLSRSPAWWFNLSISICSWYASPLNSCTHTSTQRDYRVSHWLHLHCNAQISLFPMIADASQHKMNTLMIEAHLDISGSCKCPWTSGFSLTIMRMK